MPTFAGAGCRRSAEASASEGKQGAPVDSEAVAAGVELASRLKELGRLLPPGYPGANDVMFDVEVDRDVRPISPLIYGINVPLEASRHGATVVRFGGNRTTAYNWENNASNAGRDYQYQNDDFVSDSDEPAKPILEAIEVAATVSAATIVTLSNADYVAADAAGGGDVRNSGANYLQTRFKRNRAKKPAPFAALPDRQDEAVYQDELVAFLKHRHPQASLIFSMDNEPDLWAETHAEIFPKPVTYADLWRRNWEFARAAKQVAPSAEILGFVSFGWNGFVSLQDAPDADGRNFIDWYLDQAKQAEKVEGRRLIDYLDLHWYPEAQGGGVRIWGAEITPAVVTAREQAPRSLWDATYEETSWVRDSLGGPIDLLHRIRRQIDEHYPGTKIAITEWNYGAGAHVSGAIATADVLGVFGRHGVALAAHWPIADDESFAYAAFDVFRNFDGRGGKFGDTSVSATTSDVATATIYASVDMTHPARTVLILINKATRPKRAGIRIRHAVAYGSAQVYVLGGKQPAIKPARTMRPTASNAFNYEMPAQSISVVVPL